MTSVVHISYEFGSIAHDGRQDGSAATMKKDRTKTTTQEKDELDAEYRFDYRRAKPNRFAKDYEAGSRVVVLEPDVAQVFKTPESVNAVLRALLETMPARANSRAKTKRRATAKD